MNVPLFQCAKKSWNPKPVEPPQVDAYLSKMTDVQRATESLRYVVLRWEHWVAPDGTVREWLRHNTRIGAWLFIPALIVMPVVGFILWQVSGWLIVLTSIVGRLIVLPILFLLAFIAIRVVTAFFKR